MSVSIFVDLQSFLVGRHFVVKEFVALKNEFEFSHYIFGCSEPWSIVSPKRKDTRRLRITMEYNGRMEWFHTAWLEV